MGSVLDIGLLMEGGVSGPIRKIKKTTTTTKVSKVQESTIYREPFKIAENQASMDLNDMIAVDIPVSNKFPVKKNEDKREELTMMQAMMSGGAKIKKREIKKFVPSNSKKVNSSE